LLDKLVKSCYTMTKKFVVIKNAKYYNVKL